jgi:type VI secretion system protein ImpM
MRSAVSDRIGYFGKLPARSDFVKVAYGGAVTGMLDGWLAQVMSRLPSEPRWKLHYDAMAPVSFAFVGPMRRHAVCGHLVASHDQSGRRFPFLMMRALDVAAPRTFTSRCPIAFEPLWSYFELATPRLLEAVDPAPQLHALTQSSVALAESDAALADFLATGTVSSLGALLGIEHADRLILALGLLLQPVMRNRPARLHKSLVLPLPADVSVRCAVAAFWLELLVPFLRNGDFDLALFVTRKDGKPVLVVGFCGAVVETLRAIIDPMAGLEQQVSLADTGWVDEQVGIDIDVRALASYLDQPELPLRVARDLFLKTFIGAAL